MFAKLSAQLTAERLTQAAELLVLLVDRCVWPNSASCERVFALLKSMFGEEQMSALTDYIQSALMLRYNKRCVG